MQQINQADAQVRAEDVKLASVKDLRDLMVRNGFYVPALKSKYCTLKTLLAVKRGVLFGLKYQDIMFREITHPPNKKVLLEKLIGYVQAAGGDLGATDKKGNYPDKEWMINVIATLSKGQDEILQKNYMPPRAERDRSSSLPARMVDNQDGFYSNVPQGMFTNQKGKGIALTAMTKEERLKAKIAKAEEKIKREHERQ